MGAVLWAPYYCLVYVSRVYTKKKREGVEALSMTRGARKWTWRAAIGPGVLCLTEKGSKQRGGRYGGHSVMPASARLKDLP